MRKNFLRAVACVMAVIMVLSVAPLGSLVGLDLFGLAASAAYVVESGKCGKAVRYTLDNSGVLTISGTGKMYDYDYNSPFGEMGSVESVVICNGVTSIGNFAFNRCVSLKNAEISNSVVSIGEHSFNDCYELTSISIPESVTTIGQIAFYDCRSLTGITVDENNKMYSSVDGALFNKDKTELIQYPIGSKRNEYKIPNSVKKIGDWSFYNCSGLTSITISKNVTSIGSGAFSDCDKLTSIKIPDSVTRIEFGTFWDCIGLKSITIPNSVSVIENYAFLNCTDLKSITVPKSVKKIGNYALGYTIKDGNIDETIKMRNFIIKGYEGTAAEKYAKNNGVNFLYLVPISISKCTVSAIKPLTYTGKALRPTLTVKNGKITLKAGTHYTVTYKNNTKIGRATVTIKGVEKNGYSGTKTLTFNIIPANVKNLKATQTTSSVKLTWSKVTGAQGYRVFKYDGKKWVKVADTKNTSYTVSKLKAGTNYKFAVKAYAKSGGTTYYSSSYTQLSVATKPGTPTLKATAGAKKVSLSWNKQTGANGYVVCMATSKNGKYNVVATVKGGTKVSYTKTGLAKGKTYYFKVVAYKTVSGKNLYGSYSAVKSVKAK